MEVGEGRPLHLVTRDQQLMIGKPCRDMRGRFAAGVEKAQLHPIEIYELSGRNIGGLILSGLIERAAAADMEILGPLSGQAEAEHTGWFMFALHDARTIDAEDRLSAPLDTREYDIRL